MNKYNDITTTAEEKMILGNLNKVLIKHDIDRSLYSLNGYSEDKVCLEKTGSAWVVYTGERGLKHNKTSYKTLQNACIHFISEISESFEEESKLKYDFGLFCKQAVIFDLESVS